LRYFVVSVQAIADLVIDSMSIATFSKDGCGRETYVFGLLAHAISDALFEALQILMDIPLVFE
jgi:hypothetical protein